MRDTSVASMTFARIDSSLLNASRPVTVARTPLSLIMICLGCYTLPTTIDVSGFAASFSRGS